MPAWRLGSTLKALLYLGRDAGWGALPLPPPCQPKRGCLGLLELPAMMEECSQARKTPKRSKNNRSPAGISITFLRIAAGGG